MCVLVRMCSASVRRTSMREKKAMSMKEAREEAQKLLESTNAPLPADDDDDEGKSNAMNGSASTTAVTVLTQFLLLNLCCFFFFLRGW